MNAALPSGRDHTALADRVVKAGLVFLVFSVPLVFTTLCYEVANPPKFALSQTIILVLSVVWFARMNAQGRFVFYPTALFWTLIIYIGAQALSLLKATNVAYGLFELRIFLFWFMAYLLVLHHVAERDILRMFSAITVAGAIASVYGILQHFGIDFLDYGMKELPVEALSSSDRVRLYIMLEILKQGPATFGHNNYAAQFSIAAIPLACGMLFLAKRWVARLMYGIALVLMACHLYITVCRGAFLGLAVGILVCVWLVFGRAATLARSVRFGRFTRQHLLWMRRVFVIAVVIVGVAAGLHTKTKGTRGLAEYRTVSRISIWVSSSRALLGSPWLGVGKGNFEIATPPYWKEYEKDVFADRLQVTTQAHNEYLETAVETGLIGLGAFMAFVVCLAFRFLTLWKQSISIERRAIALSVACALTAVLVHSLFSFNLQTPASALNFFVLVGVLDLMGIEQERRATTVSPKGRGGLLVRAAIWVALLTCVVVVPFYIVRPFLTQVRMASGSIRINRGDREEGIRELESAARLTPWNWTALRKLGFAYLTAGEYDKAAEHLRACLAAHPNYVAAWADLAYAYLMVDQVEKAMESAQYALSLAPTLAMSHNVLGQCYARQERWQEALEELKLATRIPASARQRLYRTMAVCYYNLGQFDEALRELERAVEQGPVVDPAVHLEKGDVLFQLKRYAAAVDSLDKGVRLLAEKGITPASNRSVLSAYCLMARAYLEGLDQPHRCSAIVVGLSQTLPQDPAVKGLTDELHAYLTQPTFSRQGTSATWYHLGASFLLQQRYDEAEEAFTILIGNTDPDESVLKLAYHDLAIALFRKKEYDRALQIIDKAEAIAPHVAPTDDLKRAIISEKSAVEQMSRP